MMNTQHHLHIQQPDNHAIPLYQWTPENEPIAVIHISHGMAEYGLRYKTLATDFNKLGFVVYAHDHRGHGETISHGTQGHFADQNGWQLAVNDIAAVAKFIEERHSDLPCFMLGHSTGSYLLQSYLQQNSLVQNQPEISGVILSSSNYTPGLSMLFARAIAKLEIMRQGKTGHSKVIERLTFADFNRRFKPQRTDFDWLSRDEKQVDAYINDPQCGFPCTNQLWADLFAGLHSICSVKALKSLPENLPILILGGAVDPVSAPRGQHNLAAAYRKAGLKDVTTHIYPDGRHEMFNEINRDQVVERLIQWMMNHLPEKQSES